MLYESRWMMKKRDFVEKCLMTDESTDWTFTAYENYSTSDWRFSACCGIIFDQLEKRASCATTKSLFPSAIDNCCWNKSINFSSGYQFSVCCTVIKSIKLPSRSGWCATQHHRVNRKREKLISKAQAWVNVFCWVSQMIKFNKCKNDPFPVWCTFCASPFARWTSFLAEIITEHWSFAEFH